jgi:hypothetical protein
VTPTLQFALTFVMLVVLATLLYRRMARYEQHMREEKEGVLQLNERLQALIESLDQIGTDEIQQQLTESHEVLKRIADKLDRPVEVPHHPVEGRGQSATALLDLVEAKLYNLGYDKVMVVGDLSEAEPHARTRVVVEAEKDGVAHKGHLVLNGAAVTELEMTPSYQAFP